MVFYPCPAESFVDFFWSFEAEKFLIFSYSKLDIEVTIFQNWNGVKFLKDGDLPNWIIWVTEYLSQHYSLWEAFFIWFYTVYKQIQQDKGSRINP